MENNLQIDNSFVNENSINDYLLETSKWGKFLAIMGFIGMGLMIIFGLFMFVGASRSTGYDSGMGGMFSPMGSFGAAAGFVYIIMAVIFFIPVNYLYQFSVKMKQGLQSNDGMSIAEGFKNLKSLFKFYGIFTIVILSIYALVLLIAIPAIIANS